jgi:hypothetical protein
MVLTELSFEKKTEIQNHFKNALEATTVDIQIGEATLVVASSKDKIAYQDVWFSMLTDEEKTTIKDCTGKYFQVTKAELHKVIASMIDVGKTLWVKKETLISKIDSIIKNDSLTEEQKIEEINNIKWE